MQFKYLALFATVLFATVIGHETYAAEKIGKHKTIEGDVYGTPPEDKRSRAYKNDKLSFGEIVETSGGAATRIIFNDKSELFIGQRAELTIDEFVYDPKSNSVKTIFNISAGAIRYVSGKGGSKTVEINTPAAHLGIRGSETIIFVTPSDETVINVTEGRFAIRKREESGGDEAILTRNQNISISSDGPTSNVGSGIAFPKEGVYADGRKTDFRGDYEVIKKGGRLENPPKKDRGGSGGGS